MRHLILIALTLLIVITACENYDEMTVINDQFVIFKFINGDSINELSDSLSIYLSTDTALNMQAEMIEESISELLSGIDSIQLGLDTGNLMYLDLFNDLSLNYREDSTAQIDLLASISENELTIDSVQNIITELKEGIIQLESIEAVFSGYVDDGFTDSTDEYKVPLNIEDTISEYIINFDGRTYLISLTHTNTEMVSQRREYYIQLSDITIHEYSFDQVLDNCNHSICNSNEAIFTCYY
jgi:hypothetical protein